MPIYEYTCSTCGVDFEHLTLSRREPGPESCPECGSTTVSRKVSLSSFALKGGGWYKDGYSSTGGAAKTSEASSSGSSSSASAGATEAASKSTKSSDSSTATST